MSRKLDAIVAELDVLQASDFDLSRPDSQGIKRLHTLSDELRATGGPQEVGAILFSFIERVTAGDLRPPRFDFGCPGPLAHSIEKLTGYEHQLFESLCRQPAPLTVWMLNRIINVTTNTSERKRLLNVMRDICSHPNAASYTREVAAEFLRFQAPARSFDHGFRG